MGNTVTIDEQVFTDIADAIRDRNGETATYKPREMAAAVEDLHNVRVKKWVRPSDWPDYSKVDLTDQEIIYLTYDCTYDNRAACFLLRGAYTVTRGQIDSNGTFIASAESTNVNSGSIFTEYLPTDEGDYVVYKIEPQEGHILNDFRFRNRGDSDASATIAAWYQPCIERYANLPNITSGLPGNSANETWNTRYLIADTVWSMAPSNINNIYNNGSYAAQYVDYSKSSFKNVTQAVNSFINQFSLLEIHLPHDLSNKCISLQQIFYNCSSLVYLDLTGWDTSGCSAFNSAFRCCNNLVEIKGLDSFDLTSAKNLSYLFDQCNMLRDIDASKWETTNKLTDITSMFGNCWSLKSLDLSGFNTENVASFSSCFYSCRNIKTIDLSSWIVSSKTIYLNGMFAYMRVLENLIRNKDWDTSNVTNFEGMFRECKNLKEIDVSDFDFSKTANVRYMFMQCNSLRKIKGTFNLPLVTNKTNVTDFATNCWMLEDLSELSITNSTYMPGFGSDYSILHFRMPVVSTLADSCLRDMNHCRVFDFRDYTAVPTLTAYTDINNGKNTKMKIVVPDNLYDTWIAATNWSNTNIKQHIISASDYEASLVTE